MKGGPIRFTLHVKAARVFNWHDARCETRQTGGRSGVTREADEGSSNCPITSDGRFDNANDAEEYDIEQGDSKTEPLRRYFNSTTSHQFGHSSLYRYFFYLSSLCLHFFSFLPNVPCPCNWVGCTQQNRHTIHPTGHGKT